MSRTGASDWRAPVASIRRRIVAAIASTSAGVPGRGRADRLLEARGVAGDEAVERLLVEDRRDPQPGLLDEEALDLVGQGGHLAAPQVRRAGHPRDLADPEADQLPRPARGRASPVPTISNDQTEPSWATFSSRVIRTRRSRDPLVDRERGVAVARCRQASTSALHRAGRQAADDLPLRERVEDDGGQDRDDREGQDARPGRRRTGPRSS